MAKKRKFKKVVGNILIGILIITLGIAAGKLMMYHEEYCDRGTVDDVIQVSAGGFMTGDRCILVVDGKKGTYTGNTCLLQMGDTFCK